MYDIKEYIMPRKSAKSIAATKAWETRRFSDPKKRGRKLGVKVGPYKIITLKMLHEQLKELRAQVAKHEKVLG